MREENNFNKKLLVEGKSDLQVVYAYCKQNNIPTDNFYIKDCGGIIELKKLASRIFKQDISVAGLIVDADTNLGHIWVSLKDSFSKQGFDFSKNKNIPQNGLILENDNEQKVGIWIMPNNDLNGILEDFVKLLIPEDDNLKDIAENTLIDIENKKFNKYALKDRQKVFMNTWLAWQKESGISMELAITKKILSTNNQNAQDFTDWLTNLFK